MSKISELTEITYPFQDGDWIPIVRGSTTYKADPKKLFQTYQKFVSGYDGYTIIAASGNTDPTIVQQDDILVGKGAFYNGAHVTLRALQDSPTQDSEFALGMNIEE